MNDKVEPYHVVDLPAGRRAWLNTLDLGGPKHSMYGLLEVDVTVARQFIEDYRACTGELLSFTGFLTYCLARAVDDDKTVQAYLKGGKQLILFDDVNVGLMIERKLGDGDKRTLTGHVIRAANHKTYREIHQEIRTVQATLVPPNRGMPAWFRSMMSLPWPFPRFFSSLFKLAARRDPTMVASMSGTVGVTAVGMFGEGQGGWGLYTMPYSLGLVVGSIAWKPAIVEGRIEPREILNLTVMFDHNIVDGGPAARFTRRLVELIESGYGLDEYQAIPAMDNEPVAVQAVPVLA